MNEPVEQSSSIRCSCGSGSKQSIERRKAIKATNKHPHKQQLLHTHTHTKTFLANTLAFAVYSLKLFE